jgi:hypothetical protein
MHLRFSPPLCSPPKPSKKKMTLQMSNQSAVEKGIFEG